MKITSPYRPENVALIELLKEHRLRAGLTQTAVASRLGISQTGVSDMELGARGVDFLVARDLCHLYGIKLEQLSAELDKRLRNGAKPAPRIHRKDRKRK